MGDGPNVGYGVLSLIPSMKGSEAILAKISRDAGHQAGGVFKSSFANGIAGLGKVVGLGLAAGAGAAAVGLFKLGESFDEQFDKIRVSSGQTGDALKGLEGDFKSVLSTTATDFTGAGDAVSILNQRLGLTGHPLQTLSKEVIDLARITKSDLGSTLDSVTGLFNNFGVAAKDQPKKLDELYRAAQASGIAVGDLASQMSSSGPVLRLSGLSFESSAALLATLAKSGLSASDVLPALSRNLKEAAKAGKAPDKVLASLFAKIKAAKRPQDAINIAIESFGAKGGKMADLIRSGALSVDQLNSAILSGHDTIEGASDDTADFSEKWTILKNRVLVGLEPIATRVFNAVGAGLDIVSAWWTQNGPGVSKFFSDLGANLRDTLGPAFKTVFDYVRDTVLPRLGDIATWIITNKAILEGLAITVGTVIAGAFLAWAASALTAAAATLLAIWPFTLLALIAVTGAAAVGWLTDKLWNIPFVRDAFLTAMQDGVDIVVAMVDAFQKLYDLATKIEGPLKTVMNLAGGGSGGFLGKTLKIAGGFLGVPGFADGGTVPGPKGRPLLAIVHGGEQVVSNEMQSRARGSALRPMPSEWYESNGTITITNVTLLDGKEVARSTRAVDRKNPRGKAA